MEGLKKFSNALGWTAAASVFATVAAYRWLLDRWPWSVTACGAMAILSFAAFLVAERGGIAGFFRKGRVQLGLNAALLSLAGLAILGALNYLAARHNARWDFTSNSVHTLAEQSRKVAASLTQDVHVYAFLRADARRPFDDLIHLYRNETPHIIPEAVDPLERPDLAEKYKVQDYGVAIFVQGETVKRASEVSEEAFTKTLVELTTGESRVVYFLTGHGERSIESVENDCLQLAREHLESLNYSVKNLSLLEKQEVPEDAAALVVAAPLKAPLEKEFEALASYVNGRAGRMLFLADKGTPAAWRNWLLPWGIRVEEAFVVDSVGSSPFVTASVSYSPAFAATRDFEMVCIFPIAVPVTGDAGAIKGGAGGYAESVAFTGKNAWGERKEEGVIQFDEKVDMEGPLPLAAYATVGTKAEAGGAAEEESAPAQKPEGRVAAVGDADFASNAWLNFYGNADFFANLVNWLAERESLIGVAPNKMKASLVHLTPGQETLMFYSTVWGLPIAVGVLGFVVWNRRRHL